MNLAKIKKNYVIELRNKPTINSDKTICSYMSAFDKFCDKNSRIYRMTEQELKIFLANFRKEYSDSYYNIMGSCLKILFCDALKQPRKMAWFKSIPTKSNFGKIITHDEFIGMGKKCKNIKHKLIIVLLYSTGIRRSELISIKLSDLDFVNNRIFIKSAKGGKNGYVQMHSITRKYLIAYIKKWRPREYLLNGQISLMYSASSIFNLIKTISNGRYHPHDFRHTYLSNLIEHENIFAAKEIARHSSIKSTMCYYHIPKDKLNTMYSPMDVFTK